MLLYFTIIYFGDIHLYCKKYHQIHVFLQYNDLNVDCRELAPGTVSLTGPRATVNNVHTV